MDVTHAILNFILVARCLRQQLRKVLQVGSGLTRLRTDIQETFEQIPSQGPRETA